MDFNKRLEILNTAVMALYPSARFYEAQGIMKETDGDGIKPSVSEIKSVYALPINKTLIVTSSDSNPDIPVFEIVDSLWCEDKVMTPFVEMSLEDAFEQVNKANFVLKDVHVTLRHPLHPKYTRPVYIFGNNKSGGYSVDVITGDVLVENA